MCVCVCVCVYIDIYIYDITSEHDKHLPRIILEAGSSEEGGDGGQWQ